MPDPFELVRTGFFREMQHGDPTDPSLVEARSATPDPDENRAASYLDAGHVYIATAGPCEDVFAPGTKIGPPHYLTDGRFLWPGDLSHYVRAYHVRLADDLVDHMRASGWAVPDEVDMTQLAVPRRSPGPDQVACAPAASTATPGASSADAESADAAGAPPPPAAELAGRIAGVFDALAAGGVDRAAVQRSIEDASAAMAKAISALGQQLRKTLGAADAPEGAQLSASLEKLRAWSEQSASTRAADVQAYMTSLETQLEQARAPERRAQIAERAERLGKQIRETIADRLRQHGITPTGEADKPSE